MKTPNLSVVRKTSPDAVRFFLKEAALEREWTPADMAAALGVDRKTARQIAGELALVGYAEPVRGKKDVWRNSAAGNTIAGVRPPRLTRKTAERLLTDIADRAEAFNLDKEAPLRIGKIIAFGGINTKHERLQDIDLGVQLEPKLGKTPTPQDRRAALKALRGRSAALKLRPLEDWMTTLPSRLVWQK